ncbi:transmembrane protein 254 isoform X1 [Alexandromys fortis]|uniref:transmembrane protein 254 isoform X1 n=1 Tax=Alexandromys fortis TaxID=100897 RepID=UPI0021527E69|nr:transmembrane protein 254 isoform X1 [Microtus fortis]
MGTAPGAGYFQRGSLFWFTVITVSFSYYTWVVFWPQSVPYQSLGPLGPFTKYLVDHHYTLLRNGYWLTCLIHVGESIYAMVLCKHKGITDGQAQLLWFLQTFLFGIASLSILIAYRPKHKKHN